MKTGNRENLARKFWHLRSNNDPVRNVIATAKERMLAEYGLEAGAHVRLLRLALNEAEALAWHSGFPQLFFRELAVEKANAVVRWARRQRAVRRKTLEISFAE